MKANAQAAQAAGFAADGAAFVPGEAAYVDFAPARCFVLPDD